MCRDHLMGWEMQPEEVKELSMLVLVIREHHSTSSSLTLASTRPPKPADPITIATHKRYQACPLRTTVDDQTMTSSFQTLGCTP
jgi:hypothetical protein